MSRLLAPRLLACFMRRSIASGGEMACCACWCHIFAFCRPILCLLVPRLCFAGVAQIRGGKRGGKTPAVPPPSLPRFGGRPLTKHGWFQIGSMLFTPGGLATHRHTPGHRRRPSGSDGDLVPTGSAGRTGKKKRCDNSVCVCVVHSHRWASLSPVLSATHVISFWVVGQRLASNEILIFLGI